MSKVKQLTAAGPQVGMKELGVDAWHHLVYAVATAVAYELLS
ncbi:MAG TPA: hypothetical protein VFB06_33665 [Streptosporangiaceae bacterium]|nr:hypothetical protein [Streptosporangiaceae bacterium]